jgi:Domain of unknown function (DUF4055)
MSVTTQHREYQDYLETWMALRAAYVGSGAVKTSADTRGGGFVPSGVKMAGTRYLPRPAGMKLDAQYAVYRDRAVWGEFTSMTVHGIGGAVFRKEPVIEAPAAMDGQLEDVTQTGVPLRTFAEQAMRETLLMGRFGVLVDFPQLAVDQDGREMPDPDARPYWIAYQAEEIMNWRTERRQGDTVLTLVVLRETASFPQGPWGTDDFFILKEVPQYRVLRLDEFGHYEVSVWREIEGVSLMARTHMLVDRFFPTRNRQPLDFIPFCFMAPFSLEPQVEKSLMEPLVEINYRYYRHSADYEHALFLLAPTPYVCSDSEQPTEPLLIGSSVAWWIQGAASKVGILANDPAGLPAYQIAMDTDVKDMAAKGARMLEGPPTTQETATANRNRLTGTESPVQSLVTTVSQGLTQALQIHAWWGGFTKDVDDTAIHITLNKDIVASRMEPPMLLALMQALLNDTISYETFYYNLQQGEIARPMIEADEEKDLIDVAREQRPLVTPPGPARPGVPVPPNGATPAAVPGRR